MVSIAHNGYVAEEYAAHGEYEDTGFSRGDEHAFNESARRSSESAGSKCSKRRHISCSTTFSPGELLKPIAFPQPRIVPSQDDTMSKISRAATSDLDTREENQYALSNLEKGSNSGTAYLRKGQPYSHHWSACARDIVSLAFKQHELFCLDAFTWMQETIYLAQSAPSEHAAMGEECHVFRGSTQSSAARCASMPITHATGSESPRQRSSTETYAQESATGNGLALKSGYLTNAQATGLGSGDGGDDPDDPSRQFNPLRGHEIDSPDGGRRLMLDVCAKFHQRSHLQDSENPESSTDEARDRPKDERMRIRSYSDHATGSVTVDVAQRSGSAPAQTQCPQESDEDEADSDDDDSSLSDSNDPGSALNCGPRMVRASDITGEPNVDAPWTHHMRPSSLLELRRGAEGYGGRGGLACLPDAHALPLVENEPIVPETLSEAHGFDGVNQQTATNRDSFSFVSSVSFVSQHEALAEEPPNEPDESIVLHGRDSIVSQHTALVDGPPEELNSSTPPQDPGLAEGPFAHATSDMQTSEHVECREPRRPSVPHMTPQVLLDSGSGDEPWSHTKSQNGSVHHSGRERCTRRQRQGYYWSSVLCCLGNPEHNGRSSSEYDGYSLETASPQKYKLQNHKQDRRNSRGRAGGRQGPGLGQTPAPTEVLQEAYVRAPVQISTKCPRTRFAKPNERWRDPTSRP